ncbi:MAG: hypothetical protein NTZ64_12020 [Polaromonas sp.]|nr:hypothetical protein [Polaromonas sp.]
MRPLFFALMIALLLLRGWTGDAMANSMALAPLQHAQPSVMAMQMSVPMTPDVAPMSAAPQAAHKAAHKAAPDAEQAMTHDCAEHTAPDDNSPAASPHCQSCDACQACHGVALIPPATRPSAAFNPRAQPPAPAARFASADAAPGQKPPIS